jgi:tellurite resistance protein TehA-like permease
VILLTTVTSSRTRAIVCAYTGPQSFGGIIDIQVVHDQAKIVGCRVFFLLIVSAINLCRQCKARIICLPVAPPKTIIVFPSEAEKEFV